MPRGMHFSRRNKGITNYRKRLALLKSGMPRAVVRFSNAKVSVQIIEFTDKGDKVLASANSADVTGMGWKGSKTFLFYTSDAADDYSVVDLVGQLFR